MNAKSTPRRRRPHGPLLQVAAALLFVFNARAAAAEGVDDVLLKSGGRLRGLIMEVDAKTVRVRLPDGEIRTIPAGDVAKINYSDGSSGAPGEVPVMPPPPAAPAPPPVQAETAPPLPPAAPVEDPNDPRRRDSVVLLNGWHLRGVITAESSAGVTLRLPDGQERFFSPASIRNVEHGGVAARSGPILSTYGWTPPPEVKPAMHRRPGLIAGGAVMLGLGFLSVVWGGTLLAYSSHAAECPTTTSTDGFQLTSFDFCEDPTMRNAGIGLLVVGGTLVAIGIPMLVVGVKKVPDDPENASRARSRVTGLSLAPMPGKGSMGLVLTGAAW